MRIAFITTRLVEYDPISEQMLHWAKVLTQMGNEIFVLTGEVSLPTVKYCRVEVQENLSFQHPSAQWDIINAFVNPTEPPEDVFFHLESFSNILAMDIDKWLAKINPELLIIVNLTSIPIHPALTIALHKRMDTWKIRTWTHEHDFLWDNLDFFISPYEMVNQLFEFQIPFQSDYIKHLVINSYSAQILESNFQIEAEVVPYVLNFAEAGILQQRKGVLRNELKLDNKHKIILFPKPLQHNQGFELALNLMKRLNDKNIRLVVTNSSYESENGNYFRKAMTLIKKYDLENQIHYAYAGINADGKLSGPGISYSMADAYSDAHAVLFLPQFDSSGNTFLQSIYYNKPMVMSNFSPGFDQDFRQKGFKFVEVQNNEISLKNLLELETLLSDQEYVEQFTKENLALARLHFSHEYLIKVFQKLL